MIALKIIGIVLAVLSGLILLVLIALCFKISLSAVFNNNEKALDVKYLFIKKRLFPLNSISSETKKKKEDKKSEKQKNEENKSEKSFGFSFGDILEILGLFNENVIKKLFFDRLFACVSVGTPDADKTALNYGRLSAAVGPVVNGLHAAGRIKKGEVRVYPDFSSPESSCSVDISLSFVPVFILPMLFGVLKIYLKTKKNTVKRG